MRPSVVEDPAQGGGELIGLAHAAVLAAGETAVVAGELDYRNEARYMEQLRRNARDNSRERVPEVFWEYTTRRLLVTEFLEGETVLAYLRA